MKQIVFLIYLAATLGLFAYTVKKLVSYFKLTKPFNRMDNIGERITQTLLVAFGQTKMFQRPFSGLLHAMVYWGFLVITIGTAEMIIDGALGVERSLGFLGGFYDFVTLSGEIFAVIILVSCVIFLGRRYITKPKRFIAPEMKPSSRMDATFILSMIMLLMLSLIGMNMGYVGLAKAGAVSQAVGAYPVSQALGFVTSGWTTDGVHLFHEINWWIHIGLVLAFLNILPRSKHFHVMLSVPNVFFSRLEPVGKLENLAAVTTEVKLMLDPSATPPADAPPPSRFGVKDVTDVSWKTLMDAYTCTECGRCTAVCPANITGKKLSPRKIYIDTRRRMKDAGDGFVADPNYSDGKSLVGDYITEEELWACTTCGACMQECPVNIEHIPHIVNMRQYLVMEESKAPEALNSMFNNIENNGAPWALSAASRFDWAASVVMPAEKVKA